MAREMGVLDRRGGVGGKGMSMEYNEDKWVFQCFLNASAKGHMFSAALQQQQMLTKNPVKLQYTSHLL